jgi:hypothetical protein
MPEKKPCPLCKTNCVIERLDGDTISVSCPTCGNYIAPFRINTDFVNRGNSHLISGVTRNYYEINKNQFKITFQMISDINSMEFQTEILNKAPKTVAEKASLLLQYIARNSNEKPSTSVSITIDNDYPIVFAKDKNELYFYINYLTQRGLITSHNKNPSTIHLQDVISEYRISLTFDGWVEVEKLQKPNLESTQAFVAMWFDDSMNEIFEKGILPLGDEKDESYTGFKMFRVDKEQFNDEKICDKIIAEIKKSRFLIADVTGQRQAVYFEAGYAMAMGLPVIWTCKDEKEHTDKCCFDTRQYPHIFWKDADDLKNQLKNKIFANILGE